MRDTLLACNIASARGGRRKAVPRADKTSGWPKHRKCPARNMFGGCRRTHRSRHYLLPPVLFEALRRRKLSSILATAPGSLAAIRGALGARVASCLLGREVAGDVDRWPGLPVVPDLRHCAASAQAYQRLRSVRSRDHKRQHEGVRGAKPHKQRHFPLVIFRQASSTT